MSRKLYLQYFLSFIVFAFSIQLGMSQCAETVTGSYTTSDIGGGDCTFTLSVTVNPTGNMGNYCFQYIVEADGVEVASYASPTFPPATAGISGNNTFEDIFDAACNAVILVTWISWTSPQCNGTSCDNGSFVPEDLGPSAPVDLIQFKGSSKERSNLIEWVTENEDDLAGYSLERSFDGRNAFQEIGSLEATGHSNSRSFYQFEDYTPLPVSYYRLRSIDLDGSQKYSDVIVVEREELENRATFQAAPIPLKIDKPLELYYNAKVAEKVKVELADVSGRLLYQEAIDVEAGIHRWSVDVPQSSGDMLILRIHNREGVQCQLIPKLHTF